MVFTPVATKKKAKKKKKLPFYTARFYYGSKKMKAHILRHMMKNYAHTESSKESPI
jgi:hypothetical protein